MRLFVNNKVFNSTITLSGDALSGFPVSHLLLNQLIMQTYVETNIIFDFGSAGLVTGVYIKGSSSNYTVTAGTTISTTDFSMTMGNETKFISENYRYWKIKSTDDLPFFLNFVYLGSYLELPAQNFGELPQLKNNDISNKSQTGQFYKTKQITFKQQSFKFEAASEAEFNELNDWYESDDRENNFIFIQSPTNLLKFPPYYATIDDFSGQQRQANDTYNFEIKIIEAK